MKKFPCSLDKVASSVPWVISILFVTTAWALPLIKGKIALSTLEASPLYFSTLLLITLFVITYLLKPESIEVNHSEIAIDRKLRPVVIPFSDIKLVRQVEKDDMKYLLRTFGNGDFFGYTGKFYNRAMGSMTLYCTQRQNYVLIEKADGKKVIISPDDPVGLLMEVKLVKPSVIS